MHHLFSGLAARLKRKRWGWLISLFVFIVVSQAVAERFEFEEPQMGVPVRIVLHGDDPAAAERAAGAAFQRFKELNGIMSDYDSESEMSRLCSTSSEALERTGEAACIHVGDDLFAVLKESKRYSELSDGAFDITVAPVVRLWRRARRMHALPKPEQIVKAQELVGNEFWEIDEKTHSVRIKKKGVRFDLGGIAKGYAIDRAFETVQKAGFAIALVDAGGDIRVGKGPSGGWKIGVRKETTIPLENRALATSGGTFQFVEVDGVRYSHIVDPKTGLGLTTRFIVHVAAETACEADALASAFSVLGPDKSTKLLKSCPNVEVRFVDADSVQTSPCR